MSKFIEKLFTGTMACNQMYQRPSEREDGWTNLCIVNCFLQLKKKREWVATDVGQMAHTKQPQRWFAIMVKYWIRKK